MQEKALSKIILPVKAKIVLGIILSALSAISKVLAFCLFALIISNLVQNEIRIDLLVLAGVFVVAELLLRMFGFGISHKAAFELEQILRVKISSKMAKIPYGDVISLGTGELKKIMLNDVKELHSYVADTTPYFGSLSVLPVASMIALLWLDYRMFLVSVGVFFVGGFILMFAFKDNAKYRQKYDDATALINASIIEFIQAMAVVRTFSNTDNSFNKYDEALKNYADSLKEWLSFSSLSSKLAIAVLSPLPTYFALSVAGAIFYLNNSLMLGDFVGCLLVGTGFVSVFMPLMMLRNFIMKSNAAALSIMQFLNTKELFISPLPKVPNGYDLEFKNVSFKYPNKDEFALKNINFNVKNGEIIAFVGESGAGKSTAATLIPRFYDVSEGDIKIGGISIKDIAMQDLNNLISFVFQDVFLFNETIYENIIKSKPNATKDEVINAAKAANIHDFIMGLENGYDSVIGERGANLSGGEKQRISIARAILKDAPIIVLDEATAFADALSEEQIIKAISNLIKNKTAIIIAHRLSTIACVDEIFVFKNASICQNGTHDELITQDGEYKKLWQTYQDAQIWNIRGKNAN